MLATALPEFSTELVAVLVSEGEAHLADQVPALKISGRCGCGDSFCGSFYTGPRPLTRWSDEGVYRCVPVIVERGMVALDVVDEIIRHVEVLDRPEIKKALEAFPAVEGRVR